MSEDPSAARYDVLVVEDDQFLARLLDVELSSSGYSVRVAYDGEQALEAAFERCPDLVLADVMMPRMDGFEMVRRLRGDPRTESVSIILVTARGLQTDKLTGLTAGADDYVVKPFSSRELTARIRAVLRRSAVGEPAGQIEIGDVWIDPAMREASVRGVRLQLPAREFDLLCLLMQNAGRVVRREDIMDELWGGDWFGSTKTLDVHVGRLRRRIGAGTGVDGHITTIRRVGFRFATEDDLALSPRRPPAVAAKQPRTG